MLLKNKIVGLLIAAALTLPVSALAVVEYSRSPGGASITSPVVFNVSLDDFSDVGACGVDEGWLIYTNDEFFQNVMSEEFASTTLSVNPSLSFPLGTTILEVYAMCSPTGTDEVLLEGNGVDIIFTIIEGGLSGFSVISTGSAFGFLSGVGSAVKTSGSTIWVIVAVAIGIPLTFVALNFVSGLFPRKRR